ncbi:MAG: ABC transporter substrate-binding protein [Bacillota bacterium]|jgi:ABC-type transport system substrate-binding protein
MKRYVFLVLVLMLVSALLSGCGGNAGSDPSGDAQGEKEPVAAEPEEKVIYTSIYWDYWSLDPAIFAHKQPNALVTGIYEGLVAYDANMKLVPLLATSWDVSDDRLEYVFHLRKDVKFHKGYGEMKASDVVFTFQRMKDLGNKSTAGAMLGVDNFQVAAADDYTVKFTFKTVDPAFMTHMALWCGFIVSQAAVNDLGEAFERNPVGTGPFEFVSATWKETTEMAKFADYWGKPAGVDRVICYYITDEDTMYNAFQSGELNMINSESSVKNAEYAARDDVKMTVGASNQVIGFGLSTAIKPLNDIRVREAIFLAIDIDDFVQNFLDAEQKKTTCMIPESCSYALNDCFIQEYSIEKAKQLLAEAGYPNGFDLEIGTTNDSRAEAAAVLQSYLAKIGINAKVSALELAAFGEKAEAGEFGMWYCGWTASVLPDDFLVRGWTTDGIFNYSTFHDAAYDKLITSAVAETNEDQRAQYYYDAQRYLRDQYVYYPMYTLRKVIVTTDNISGDPFTTLRYPFNFQTLEMK